MSNAAAERQLRGAFAGFDPESVPSPSYVVDKAAVQYNVDVLRQVMDASSAKITLALKGFSMYSLAPIISKSLTGTAASSVHEARLGKEKYGGEVHAYAPAYSDSQMDELLELCNHIVFNSFSQWERHRKKATAAAQRQAGSKNLSASGPLQFGIRINPEYSEGTVPLYDPCAPFSRMGVTPSQFREDMLEGISGLHFHTLCEQGAEALQRTFTAVEEKFGAYLKRMSWINLGGGHHITKSDYNRELLVDLLRRIRSKYGVDVYLEPGEAVAIHSGVFVTSVLDCIHNGMDIAILDCSATCHMPDILEMPYRPEIWGASAPGKKSHDYRLGSQTCLAGDVIGDYSFDEQLYPGDRLVFDDMAHYTMVKTTTFNGIVLPAICSFDSRNSSLEIVREFGYAEFKNRLS